MTRCRAHNKSGGGKCLSIARLRCAAAAPFFPLRDIVISSEHSERETPIITHNPKTSFPPHSKPTKQPQ